jgi:hypothetical protein
LARDFGLTVYAAFTGGGGCTGGTVENLQMQSIMRDLLNTNINHVLWITNIGLAQTMANTSTRDITPLRILCPQLTNTSFMVAMEQNLATLMVVLGA